MDDRMAYLKSLLVPYRWQDFLTDEDGRDRHPLDTMYLEDIKFEAGFGLHLGSPALAIMAEDKFIVIRHVRKFREFVRALNPQQPQISGFLGMLDQSILNDKVIRET